MSTATGGAGGYRLLACGCLAPADASRSAGGGAARAHRIDVHHHILPPEYLALLGAEKIFRQAGGIYAGPLEWTPAGAVELMDRCGVATGIASVSAPGTWFGDVEEGRKLSRICNEYAAKISADHPGRFGSFAALPLPDLEGSLREIEYAFDILKADGICLMTSYGNRWPGEKEFAPVFDELNRRNATVFFHPTVAPCSMDLITDVPDSVIEFPIDTMRAVVSLLYSGTFTRCRNIKFIFSHAGAGVPLLAARISGVVKRNKRLAEMIPEGPLAELKRLYYDTALSARPETLAPLLQLVTPANILFGTDTPWGSMTVADTVVGLAKHGFSPMELRQIEQENALKMMPSLPR
ncbi:MAG: amidohydrolase [Betaproteobacteria bacterium]|nr:amidohydrolase [Betaproteobacteria bacterium]